MKKILSFTSAVTACLLLLWCIVTTAQHAAAEAHCSTKRNSTLKRDRTPSPESITKAIARDPKNGAYWYKKARQRKGGDTGTPIADMEQALSLAPVTGKWWSYLGSTYAAMGYAHPDQRAAWVHKADNAYILAEHFSPRHASTLYSCARYWMWRSSLSAASDNQPTEVLSGSFPLPPGTRHMRIEKSRILFRKSLALQGRNWKKAVQYVATIYPDQKMILSIIPPENTRLTSRVQKWLKEQRML